MLTFGDPGSIIKHIVIDRDGLKDTYVRPNVAVKSSNECEGLRMNLDRENDRMHGARYTISAKNRRKI
jgi:hypothetical protein